jgi:hypothetical protein
MTDEQRLEAGQKRIIQTIKSSCNTLFFVVIFIINQIINNNENQSLNHVSGRNNDHVNPGRNRLCTKSATTVSIADEV